MKYLLDFNSNDEDSNFMYYGKSKFKVTKESLMASNKSVLLMPLLGSSVPKLAVLPAGMAQPTSRTTTEGPDIRCLVSKE